MNDAVTEFVHLHLHTEYSLVDGILRVNELMPAVAAAAMPAIAVTDQGNLFAMVKCYRAALQQGLKPIVGAELTIADASGPETGRYVLLCQDAHGYRNLSRLVSRSYLEGQHSGTPVVSRDWLQEASDGLIVLSGALQGDVGAPP